MCFYGLKCLSSYLEYQKLFNEDITFLGKLRLYYKLTCERYQWISH